MDLETLRFPTGTYDWPTDPDAATIQGWIGELEALPEQLRRAVEGLSDAQLDTPYRPDGWTVRQLVHHVADSHLNGYIRTKWTLTEDTPTIKAYDQDGWAALQDSRDTPLTVSLDLLALIHQRWTVLLRALSEEEFRRRLVHPESGEDSLGTYLGQYAWHGKHHVAHIEGLKEREGWNGG